MEIYNQGDILLLKFPFTSDEDTKRRPALVILDVRDNDVLVARITTQDAKSKYDVPIKRWQEAGLKAPSVVRLHKLATLEKNLVDRKLGRLTPEDSKAVRIMLAKLVDTSMDEESK